LAEGASGVDEAILRRFVEASRRAEIIALVNSARTEAELGEVVAAELCEAYEAEVAFVLAAQGPGAPPELVGSSGLGGHADAAAAVLEDATSLSALDTPRAAVHTGDDLLGLGRRRLALAPFRGDRGGRAAVGVARRYDQDFDAAELALLEAVTEGVGHALERAWLGVERERHAAQQAAIARAANLLNSSLELEEVVRTLSREVRLALATDVVVVMFADGQGRLQPVGDDGARHPFGPEWTRGSAGLADQARRDDAPQATDAYREQGHQPAETPAGDPIHAAIAVPLHRDGRPDGVLQVLHLTPRAVAPADVELLTAFAELASGAFRNADEHAAARRAASLDSLTGCLNHAAFQTRLREEISRAERGAEPFTLALVDLDGFKAVNERFGHLTGDTVLRTAGELLRGAVRLHDQVARFGGDEFALLLPATDMVTAQAIVDRTLEALTEAPPPGGEALTARAGLASWTWGDQATAVIERADGALRDAKRQRPGRPVATAPAGEPVADGISPARRRGDRRTERLAVAGEMGARLSRLLDPQAIARTAVGDMRALGYEACALLRAEEPAPAEVASTASPHAREPDGAVARCLRERRPVLVTDADRDPLYAGKVPPETRSLLAVPLYTGSTLWGAIEVRSRHPASFDPADAHLVQTIADHIGGALLTAELYRELEQTYVGTAAALAAALEAKDDYTADHAQSIADLAVEVGRELGLDRRELRDLRYGAIFHDIGKIAVPDAILHKPGKLTDAEFEVVKRHPAAGEQILAPVPFLADVRRIVRHDHERWDGGGYPDGLRGTDIPVGARIVFVVDAYHAMVSDRPYRMGMPEGDAQVQLRAGAGTQFDPDVVEAFLRVLDRPRAAGHLAV
jgi:diguanylate cyclase (GGDEF)-like protein